MAAIAAADRVTGRELGFFVFYFLPIAGAAWALGLRAGLATAVVAAAVWGLVDAAGHAVSAGDLTLYWNAGIRLASFLLIAAGVARFRALLARERRLNEELSEALAKVKHLRGLLPICGHCKKIRNDTGYWQRLESYLEEHSDAAFSHGICPDCLSVLYRELDAEEARKSSL
jgi:hypothetical protein